MTAGLPAKMPIAPATSEGADLLGWSALPLLAEPTAEGNWLFVLEPFRAWQSSGSLAEARFADIALPPTGQWPFADGSLEGIVLDGDALAQSADEMTIRRSLKEAARAVGSVENVLVVCRERRLPRGLREMRHIGRHSAHLWRRAIAAHGGQTAGAPSASAIFDGQRLTDLLVDTSHETPSADRVVLSASTGLGAARSSLRSMARDLSMRLDVDLCVDRVGIRKIGKTAIFLTASNGRRYILRVARSPVALSRAVRNFEALSSLHGGTLPSDLLTVVPRAVGRGEVGPYVYFLEERLDGGSGPSARASHTGGWPNDALSYISRLHAESARRADWDERLWHRFIAGPIEILKRACGSDAITRTLDGVLHRCGARLSGHSLTLVRTHGDFTDSNCLYNSKGELAGVVDWELSDSEGLPLMDLLQLMPVLGERGSALRWQRFDAWMALYSAPERSISDSPLAHYLLMLDIDPRTVPALVLAHWIAHVSDRINARRNDSRWMQLRVFQPVETLERTFASE